ncbi:PASTA domain-containing protein [Rhodohalobacter sp. SW132]|uniref:PASTA domain-containing protein n=1 Tax=Rhodohalobacter sp. SW132 TaxID=2293433 RepID=UPI000E2657F2|nr:PASTA domain-containing protein [Rhodohalobacter sp. SW132]REL33282.1 PASTA domain-containing protein [Rhodohalobacter sp. SW132]
MDLLKRIFTNKYLYIFTGGLIAFAAVAALLLNFVIMPNYTNYNEGVTVPDITKISLLEAEQLLEEYGLRHEVLDRRANAAYPANYIIDQSPSPRQLVKPNRKVYLTVNTEVRPTAVVPDLVDLSLRNARIQIENYGFTMGTTSYESSRFRNTIMRQSLTPGDTVNRGAVINLVVSDGLGDRIVTVPEITGLSLSQAQQNIRQAGLRVGEIRFESSREEPNTVLSVSPEAQELTEGETLTLVVAERFDAREEAETGAVDTDTTIQAPPDTTRIDDNE